MGPSGAIRFYGMAGVSSFVRLDFVFGGTFSPSLLFTRGVERFTALSEILLRDTFWA